MNYYYLYDRNVTIRGPDYSGLDTKITDENH